MKVHHALICFFFLSLQDGNTGLISAQVFPKNEGQNITLNCPFTFSAIRKFFCKGKCQQEDILIETTEVRAQKGKYSIEYKSDRRQLSVTITQLTKSDTGRYLCGLGTTYNDFEIIVVDALLAGESSEEQTLLTRTGGNIVVACFFTNSGSRGYFCKEECKRREDILVETTGSTVRRGKYSIRYEPSSPSGGFLYVNITQLTMSDSGGYRCGLDRRFAEDPYWSFEIIVTDPLTTSEPNLNLPAFSSAVPSASTTITTTQSLNSTSEGSTPIRDVLLYVGLTLLVMVIMLLSVLIIYRKRTSKAKDTPVETETNQVYENIREDRGSRSPPLDSSSVHTYAVYSKPKRAETNDDYSTGTAARSQNTVEDDSSRLTYSELKFSNQAVGSSSSALRGDGDNVIYSVPRV